MDRYLNCLLVTLGASQLVDADGVVLSADADDLSGGLLVVARHDNNLVVDTDGHCLDSVLLLEVLRKTARHHAPSDMRWGSVVGLVGLAARGGDTLVSLHLQRRYASPPINSDIQNIDFDVFRTSFFLLHFPSLLFKRHIDIPICHC